MLAILAAVVGLVIYALAAFVSLALAASVAVILIVILGLMTLTGWALSLNRPKLSSYLLQAWTGVMIILLGAVIAMGTYLGTILVAGDEVDGTVKGAIGAAAAIVILIVGSLKDWFSARMAPWFCSKVFLDKLNELFPCGPEGPSDGRTAYDNLNRLTKPDSWTRSNVETLFVSIRAAKAAGQYKGGSSWTGPC